jgi:hypothetical protein
LKRLAWFCCFFFWLGLVRESPAAVQGPLISPESTVVLFVGLPGDSETESNYRDQVQSWFQLFSGKVAPRGLIILYDHPETLSVPPAIQAKILSDDRASFLNLGQSLGTSNSSIVVIVWGHGGKQGATPVLHVRGPRLTPTDFSKVASTLPDSAWLLLFRGSGEFARLLSESGHPVVSSEYQTMFTSDPIGMSIVLKSLKSNPSLSFEELARLLGAGTAAWYNERNLARTEEPTLWITAQKPQLLVEPSGAGSPAVQTPSKNKPEDASTEQPSQTPIQTSSPHEKSGELELPPYWKQIKTADPKQYMDADGVILQQQITCVLGNNPALVTDQDEYIQVLTAEGKRFGDFDVAYSPPEEEVEFLASEVLRPDGKLVRMDPETAQETGEQPGGDYKVSQRRFFSLPGVVPGSVIHIRYRKEWKEFPLPQICMALPLTQELPVRQSGLRVTVPKQAAFHFAFEGTTAADPGVQQSSYSTTYAWHFTNWPALSREVLAPPHQGARLLFSTFPDWAAFGEWYERITRLTSENSPEIVSKAKELTRASTNDNERILAIYNYVTALRYVAVPLGVNSLRPHAATNVLHNQFGDCKDKASLFNALLRALDFDAHLVLVPRFGQANDLVPGLSFNHAISRVTFGGQTIWVDTTDDICRFGLLPPGDPGRKVLVVDSQVAALTELPLPKPDENRLLVKGELDASTDSASWPVSLKAAASGYSDYQLREAARETRDDRAGLPLLSVSWRPVAGSFALETQTMSPISGLEEDFAWSGQGHLLGLSAGSEKRRSIRTPVWIPKEWDLAMHRRRSPLFLNRGYPGVIDQEFIIKLPAHSQDIVLPVPSKNVKPPLRWRIDWARLADDKLAARFHAELERGELSLAETSAFQQQLRSLLASLAEDASFSTAP